MKKLSIALLISSATLLAACNGGGSSSGTTPLPVIPGFSTAFTDGSAFNATTDNSSITKVLTLSNTGESDVSQIMFTLPNGYFTIGNDTGSSSCSVENNSITNTLSQNQNCTVRVTYSNATTTNISSANIVFNYLYGESTMSYNTPVTYQTTSEPAPEPSTSWTRIGAYFSLNAVPSSIAYDPLTKSIYWLSSSGTDLCSIGVDASTSTNYVCNPVFSGRNIYSTYLTTDGVGNLYSTAKVNNTPESLYIETYNTQSKTAKYTLMPYDRNVYINSHSLLTKSLVYYNNMIYLSAGLNDRDLSSINISTGVVAINSGVLNPALYGKFTFADNGNLYYHELAGSLARYVNINSLDGVTSSIIGTNIAGLSDFTATTNNLYSCGGDTVHSIPLVGSTSSTSWTSLPPTSVDSFGDTTGCSQITNGDGSLFALATIFDNNNPMISLVKYRY